MINIFLHGEKDFSPHSPHPSSILATKGMDITQQELMSISSTQDVKSSDIECVVLPS